MKTILYLKVLLLCVDNSQGWCASVLDDAQFLQVDFVHKVKITKILVQRVDTDAGVDQFILEYSSDQKKWKNYTKYGMTKVGISLSSFLKISK